MAHRLESSYSPLAIPVEGKSLMPFCHFELEESDYLSERGGGHTLEPNVEIASAKVLEFSPCGVGQVATRYNLYMVHMLTWNEVSMTFDTY